jgi:hypothetical protein
VALNKTSIPINFAQGVDTQTDPFQVQPGKFLALTNSSFDKGGQLKKRNGFGQLTPLPTADNSFITTLGGNLTAVGSTLSAYSQGSMTWVNKGPLQPADVSVLSVVRSNVGQLQADSVTHPNGLTCTVYTEATPTGGGVLTPTFKFVITDSVTGQRITTPSIIPGGAGGVFQSPKVFLLGNNFIIVFDNLIGTTHTLQYIAVNAYAPTVTGANVTISSSYAPGAGTSPAFEGVVNNNNLYLAWNNTGSSTKITYIDSTLNLYAPTTITGQVSNLLSLCVDTAAGVVYLIAYSAATSLTKAWAYDVALNVVTGATTLLSQLNPANITSAAQSGLLTVFYEQPGVYGYDPTLATNTIRSVTMTQAGVVSIPVLVARSVGLASKAFIIDGKLYVLSIYVSNYQPTYFLLNAAGQVIVKLAYSNAAGSYYTLGLPFAEVIGSEVKFSYLVKDLVEAVNKLQGAANTGGIYSQTGINTATIDIASEGASSAEIGHDLHVTGGFMWMYDGSTPVEHGFHLWPDYVEASITPNGGSLSSQKYYYVATYEWTDGQGNVFKSAPSLPILADNTGTVGRGVSFSAIFATGAVILTVNSTANLYPTQPITDVSNPTAFPAGTKIVSIGVGTVTVNNAALANSASAPGDNMATTTVASTVTYTANSTILQATLVAGFRVGQVISDTAIPGNIPANTYIKAIDPVTNQLTISANTLGASAIDQIRASSSGTTAYFTAGSTSIRVTSVAGFGVGREITDSTVGGAFQADTHITAIDAINKIITIDKPTVSGSSAAPRVWNSFSGILDPFVSSYAGTISWGTFNMPYFTPTVGQGILYSNTNFYPGLDVVSAVAPWNGVYATIFGTYLAPNGNTTSEGGQIYIVDLHTVTQASTTFSANFTAGSGTISVSSTINLGVGQTLTDLTTGANLTAGTTITFVNSSTNTITISPITAGTTNPSTIQTSTVFSNIINVPTLRLTYKTATPVRIAIYRWSTAQQTYYQVTSVTDPLINNVLSDYVTYTDTTADALVQGNNILYTTGGIIENIAAPPISGLTLYKSRLFAIDAEDRNTLWYSKQVIENTPVEMSDLFTIYVAPTTAAQGDTGPITALAPLDDKLIIFKKNAIYYITGSGPDNTGINNDFSEPVFVTTAVGCTAPHSIVFSPSGIMFQSEKGIWMLGRDLATSFIGAPVDGLTADTTVLSAINVQGTNEVRFSLDNGLTLMYDYYFQQWGTYSGVKPISSTSYQGQHSFIDSFGRVFQETPGKYLDGGNPVLLSFTTSWLNMAGLQGYERAYYFYLLGVFKSPHTLNIQVAYDYNPAPLQTSTIFPTNYTAPWGGQQLWGSGEAWGGQSNVEQYRVHLARQKCQAFQVTVSEVYDSSKGVVAGAGLTLSGMNLIIGAKDLKPKLRASRSVG